MNSGEYSHKRNQHATGRIINKKVLLFHDYPVLLSTLNVYQDAHKILSVSFQKIISIRYCETAI